MAYNLGEIRKLVKSALGDDALQDLCFDYFRSVYDQFTPGQTKGDRIRKLVEYADRQREIPKLLRAIEEINPNVYAEFKAALSLGNVLDSEQSEAGIAVDELVQQVRSRLYDNIQSLHSTMPLWGVDRCVPLGELFVDVNILEELSSSHRSELADLWQDFKQNPTYRTLDRIGLGKERERISGLEVLAKNTNLMVVGKPGSGKTTYLQRIVTECNAGDLQADRIPVLIKLREFVDDGRSFSYLLDQYLQQYWQLSMTATKLVLNQGRSLVLLDGLDEVIGEDGKTIAKQIKQFARTYPQIQIVVTCRTQSQESRFERFDYVEVADFNEEQMQSFTEHWFNAVMQDEDRGLAKSQEFLEQLFQQENKPIRELAVTPILLSLTCAVFHQAEKLYPKRSKLYEEALELLLEQWDKSREIERDAIYRDLSVERKLELLSYLAVKKFEQEQYVLFEQAEIEGYIVEFLGISQRESRAVLRAIEAQHGLLIERAQGVWSFSHLTFQEYLVAKWFCDRVDWRTLGNYVTKNYWQEIFYLAVGIVDKADEFLQCMKLQVDQLVSENAKIQEYLAWVSEKAQSVETNKDILPVIRAFYFSFSLYRRFIAMTYGVESLNIILAIRLDRKFDYRLNNELYFDAIVVRNSTIDIDILQEISQSLAQDFQGEFKLLTDTVPKLYAESEEFQQWWQNDGEIWSKRFWLMMMKYRKIRRKWDFGEHDNELLEQYNNANILLVSCLRSSCHLGYKTQQKIEEALLLPIAEIEKRKCEKVD